MREIVLLVLLLLPGPALATADCRVIEYPDHYEAICDGDVALKAAVTPTAVQDPSAARDQTLPSGPAAREQTNEDEETRIVRSELSKRLGTYWLKTVPHE
jgi:hypothetical protein